MQQRTSVIDRQLNSLARALADRRHAVLESWRARVEADTELRTGDSLPRSQFYDHIPDIVLAYERRLLAWPAADSAQAQEERKQDAGAHGLQRWQQGYQLREVTREWGHLHTCLADEVEQLVSSIPEVDAATPAIARRALMMMIHEGISESTVQYYRLREIEAEGYVRDLERALMQLRDLDIRRTELWRQAAHDLRGNLGVVVNATEGLRRVEAAEDKRGQFLRLLQRSVSSLHEMLDDMMNLARLQAGHESRTVAAFDAAALLRELVGTLEHHAQARSLYLRVEGPQELTVEGDAIKTRRIAQNLLLNALKYTDQGGITITFGEMEDRGAERWMMSIGDTGPGFHAGPGAPLTGALEAATEEARQVDDRAESGRPKQPPADVEAHIALEGDSRDIRQERGEGIGLAIVKRLCELLDATVAVESTPDVGTIFTITFPRRYRTADAA